MQIFAVKKSFSSFLTYFHDILIMFLYPYQIDQYAGNVACLEYFRNVLFEYILDTEYNFLSLFSLGIERIIQLWTLSTTIKWKSWEIFG